MSVLAKAVIFSDIICADYKNDDCKSGKNSQRNYYKNPPAESAVFIFDFRIGRNYGRFLYNMIFRRNGKGGSCHVFAGLVEGNIKSNSAYFGKLAGFGNVCLGGNVGSAHIFSEKNVYGSHRVNGHFAVKRISVINIEFGFFNRYGDFNAFEIVEAIIKEKAGIFIFCILFSIPFGEKVKSFIQNNKHEMMYSIVLMIIYVILFIIVSIMLLPPNISGL